MKADSKYQGSIKLAAIGDALGWMTEFQKSTDGVRSTFGVDIISEFFDWEKNVGGRFHGYRDFIKAGSYSDDTQLLLCVARSIGRGGNVDQEYFSNVELPNWLYYARGAGRTIKNAATKIQRQSARWNNNFFTFKAGKDTVDYRDCGANGAAMRVLPIALANFGNPEKIKEEIFANSIITHGHPRAILGAMLMGYAIETILRYDPKSFDYVSFLTILGKDIHQIFSIPFIEKPEYRSWENEWNKGKSKPFRILFEESINEVQNQLRDVYRCIKTNQTDFNTLDILGCFEKSTKGSGTATVIAGIYLTCKYSKDPIKGIEQAVNSIGADTDSIAAFCGGLLGALHGQSIIPSRWKKVQDYDYLDRIATSLLEISEERFSAFPHIANSNFKILNEINSDSFNVEEPISFEPFGNGIIKSIDRQNTLTRGQFNLILAVDFEIGQSCVFSKLLKSKISEPEVKSGQISFYDNSRSDASDNVKLYNSLKLDYKTKDRIDTFLEDLPEEKKKSFIDILWSLAANGK